MNSHESVPSILEADAVGEIAGLYAISGKVWCDGSESGQAIPSRGEKRRKRLKTSQKMLSKFGKFGIRRSNRPVSYIQLEGEYPFHE